MANAKLSRAQLKDLVKECLVEILQEGIGSALNSRNDASEAVRHVQQGRQSTSLGGSKALTGNRRPTNALSEAVRMEARGNPLMADILADTAMTTLPNMLSNGDMGAMPQLGATPQLSGQEKIVGTPEQVFGEETASKWANLAFMPPSKKTA